MNSRRVFIGSVLALGLVALWLRVWGAGWSLPYVDHPDEPAVVTVILRIIQGDLNPRHFFYPSLIIYLQALVFKLHFWLGLLSGFYSEPLTLPRSTHFYTTIPAAFVWARVFTALLGTAAVLALATWGGRCVGRREGLIAAALLALSPWAIVHSHYITVDGPAALTGLLGLLALVPVLRRGSWRDYLLAGALLGLAAGSKYQNVILVAPFCLAHALRWRGALLQQAAPLLAAGALSALVFLLTTPYIILDFPGFMHDIETLFTSYDAGHGDIGHAWPLWRYLRFHWQEGLGPLPFLLLLVGTVALARRDWPLAVVLLSFPLLLILALLRMETHFYRNLLPAQAPLLLVSGVGAVALWDAARQYIPPHLTRPAALLALAALLLPSLVPAIQSSARLAWPDSRVVAQEWLRRSYPGVRVAGELSHPLRWEGVAQQTYVHFLPLRSPEWYREQGYGLLLANEGRRQQDTWTDAYTPLLQAGEVVFSVGGRDSRMLGPRMDVIDIGLTPATAPISTTSTVRLGPLRLLGVITGRLEKQQTGLVLQREQPPRPGDILGMIAFWLADEPVPPGEYMVFVHLRNSAGQTVAQRDTPPWQGLFPPESWPPGELVAESLDLALPDALPPGEYRLVIGLYNPTSQARYPALADGVRLPQDEADLGSIQVRARE
jgi:4-amino-4-deoxy-L-arabinose transferase-like glycosyltransferase